MKCDNNEIPSYLHWNNRATLENKDYYYFHKLYRLKPQGNPIEIPLSWGNVISCKWSKFIRKKHILLEPSNINWNDYNFVFINELRKYRRINTLNEQHEYMGVHALTCVLKHSPLACDYSHSEILIRHQVYKDGQTKPYFDEVYSYQSWKDKTAMLKKQQSKFFKLLKSDFRVDMIKLISKSSIKNTCTNDFLALMKYI